VIGVVGGLETDGTETLTANLEEEEEAAAAAALVVMAIIIITACAIYMLG